MPSLAFIEALKEPGHEPDVVIEIDLDDRTLKFGTGQVFTDVIPCVTKQAGRPPSASIENASCSKGSLTVSIGSYEIIKPLVGGQNLLQKTIRKKLGFKKDGFLYTDYETMFEGEITGWNRDGSVLKIKAIDNRFGDNELYPASTDETFGTYGKQYALPDTEIPIDITNSVGYYDELPFDLLVALLNNAGYASAIIDTDQLDVEQAILGAFKFYRVFTEARQQKLSDIISEWQRETFSIVSCPYALIQAPLVRAPASSTVIKEFDTKNISNIKLSCDVNSIKNVISIWYDYDESEDDEYENYSSIHYENDGDSVDEYDAKEILIKSKFIKSVKLPEITTASYTPLNSTAAVEVKKGITAANTARQKQKSAERAYDVVKVTTDFEYVHALYLAVVVAAEWESTASATWNNSSNWAASESWDDVESACDTAETAAEAASVAWYAVDAIGNYNNAGYEEAFDAAIAASDAAYTAALAVEEALAAAVAQTTSYECTGIKVLGVAPYDRQGNDITGCIYFRPEWVAERNAYQMTAAWGWGINPEINTDEFVEVERGKIYKLYNISSTSWVTIFIERYPQDEDDAYTSWDMIVPVPYVENPGALTYATALAIRLLNAFKQPQPMIEFETDASQLAQPMGGLLKIGDCVKITLENYGAYYEEEFDESVFFITEILREGCKARIRAVRNYQND